MEINQKIEIDKIVCRDVDANYILKLLRRNMNIYFSWDTNNLIDLNGKGLRFTVNGHHHKGHVYVVLNGADLFDVYYCSNRGTIKDIHTNIFFDQLTEIIDNKIERIADYTY